MFFTDPNHQVDPRLTLYTTRSAFAHLARETRRNYSGDCCLFFNFLWQRDKNWSDAEAEDLLDFEEWRRWSPRNPRRISGSKWDRELSALARLYKWATAKRYVAANPVVMREVLGRHGEMVSVPAQRAKDARSSNVKWLTPRAYRLWRDVGLRGYTADGRRDPSFRGRNDDRNAAYSDLLFSSGMRLSEGGSLLTFEVPALEESMKRFFDGRLAKAATKSRRERTFYVAVEDLRSVAAYERTTRRAVIRRAQARGVYEAMDDIWVLEKRSGRQRSILHFWDENGQSVQRPLSSLDVEDRQRLFVEGDGGLEPLWLWLSQDGRPFQPHSWEAVYRAASERCRKVLEGKVAQPPYFTPPYGQAFLRFEDAGRADARAGQAVRSHSGGAAGLPPALWGCLADGQGPPRSRERGDHPQDLPRSRLGPADPVSAAGRGRPGHQRTVGPDREDVGARPGQRGIGMSTRGRHAALPGDGGHRRRQPLEPGELLVWHVAEDGASKASYDFGQLAVGPRLQRELAEAFSVQCGPTGTWKTLPSSHASWMIFLYFCRFLAAQEHVPQSLGELAPDMWAAWRLSRTPNSTGSRQVARSPGC
ncbi:site-specific integrase [Streptomyces sp. OK228]|uniref:site-specific integrase n=1 Tax=Streptomyces sp. OK228 TaxID=1882786 RepID=UPI001C547F41|nr:site-specific integrase [Streptomyces sp. OK228]